MRAFIALELSDEVKNELAHLQERLRYAQADVKWVKPHNAHLTVKFLGNVAEDKIDSIKAFLDEVSSHTAPFEISLFKLGAFPSPGHPRVIWVGTDKGCSELESIAASVEEGMSRIGFPKEERPFSSHLTLGRVKSSKNKESLKEKILSTTVQPLPWTMDHITLFKSTLTPNGPIYSPLHAPHFAGKN